MTASPRPWEHVQSMGDDRGWDSIVAADGDTVIANADREDVAYIVRAVNAYEQLVDVLFYLRIASVCPRCEDSYPATVNGIACSHGFHTLKERARDLVFARPADPVRSKETDGPAPYEPNTEPGGTGRDSGA